MAEHDFHVNVKAEEEIKVIMEHLAHQDELILDISARLDTLCKATGCADKDE